MQSVLVITGPTGSGKSGLALALAERLQGTVINADSAQVYSLYPRLTAQPSQEEQQLAPHALYSSVHPPAISTADSWASTASETIREVLEEGRLPILTGGTGLYLEFLMHGRSAIPEVSEEAGLRARAEFEKLGGAAVLEKLKNVDPSSAKLRPTDTARVIRAYEVFLSSGRGIGEWQKEKFEVPTSDWNYKTIFVLPERDQLYANIDQRFLKMIDQGAMDEVAAALAQNIPDDHPAHKAVGARELRKVLEGSWKMDKAVSTAQQLSRNYAKRQFTWFKNRLMNKEKEAGRPTLTLEGSDFAHNMGLARSFAG